MRKEVINFSSIPISMMFWLLLQTTTISLIISHGDAYLAVVPLQRKVHSLQRCLYESVGIFYGTSTGNTQDCASKIYETLIKDKVDAAEPIDIDSLDAGSLGDVFGGHDALIVGTPTWNTNADTFRSGTGWDDLYYDKLPELKSILTGKKVAVFGLGDQISYGENYADAAGELYSVFKDLGCDMVSYAHTSQESYDHKTSKSILPGTDKFCGLLLDQINQDDLTDDRISKWIDQLNSGGFFESSVTIDETLSSIIQDDETVVMGTKVLNDEVMVVENPFLSADNGRSSSFTPHHNPVTGRTMWTSPDGRTSYVTTNKIANGELSL